MGARAWRLATASLGAAGLAVAGSLSAHAAGAVTDGAQAYSIENCYEDMEGRKLCATMEGRALRVVLPTGGQINRDKGTHTSEGYTKDGVYYTEAGTHHSVMVYEQYVDPWFWDDQVGRLSSSTTYSYADGTTCVVTESLVAVDSIIRHDLVEISCTG